MTAREFAAALAREIGGAVRQLPGYGEQLAVVTVDGRVPVMVRQFRVGSIDAHVPGGLYHGGAPADFDAARLATFRAAAFAWLTNNPNKLSMYGVALALFDGLGETGAPWEVNIPGNGSPVELSLTSPTAGWMGVFPHGLVNYAGGFQIETRKHVDDALPKLIEAVRGAETSHAYFRSAEERVDAALPTLITKLAVATMLPTRIARRAHVDDGRVMAKLECGGRPVVLSLVDDTLRVHAGIAGRNDIECALSALDDCVPAIRTAIETARATLTVDDLEIGARYRVLEQVGELTVGDEVIYRGFDDIENHYGEHLFDRADGKRLIVGGAYHWSLVPAHRYLEPI